MTIEAAKDFVILTAENGKIFKNKLTGDILTDKIYLGRNDVAENYEEISEGEAYAESESVQTEESENGVQ